MLRPNLRNWSRRAWSIVAALLLIVSSLGAGGVVLLPTDRPPHVPVPASVARQFAGTYYQGDGEGVRIHLTLAPDGSYRETWDNCGGRYGESNGNWNVAGKTLTLSPHRATKTMKDFERTFDIAESDEGFVFVAVRDREQFKKHGDSTTYWCFHRTDQLKQR
jgi:hypothetical protein